MSSVKLMDISISETPSKSITNRKPPPNNTRKRFKDNKGCRKRSKSFSGGPINSKPVLPTKFLLGGNINDPLNLNSLQNEDINKAMNAVTPKSSPLPTPPQLKMAVEVIISPNTHDPLHLLDCENDEQYEEHLCSPLKKGKKRKFKKRRTMSASVESSIITEADPTEGNNSEAKTPEATEDSAKIPEDPEIAVEKVTKNLTIDLLGMEKIKENKSKRSRAEDTSLNHTAKKFKSSMDKIVSPVVPQPGAWLKRTISIKLPRRNKLTDERLPSFKEENKRFQYGNYNRYYGYRNPNNEMDHRLKVFYHHPDLFENKDILDMGCNIGHVTLSIARDFKAKTVTGIDIDPKLISIARKNVKHYVKTEEGNIISSTKLEGSMLEPKKVSIKRRSEFFPLSLPILYGPIDIPGFHDSQMGKEFPNNVTFKQCNYVLQDENLLSLEQPQYDIILCLSVSKWIHLNWGDSGLKITFRRMFEQLRPGGRLILEPQHWSSYKSKKNLTETIYNNYKSIDFFPDKFREYLLSPAVGFAKSEILGYPQHKKSGFRRPIQVFTKSTMLLSERPETTPNNNRTEIENNANTDSSLMVIHENILHLTSALEKAEDKTDDKNDKILNNIPINSSSSNIINLSEKNALVIINNNKEQSVDESNI